MQCSFTIRRPDAEGELQEIRLTCCGDVLRYKADPWEFDLQSAKDITGKDWAGELTDEELANIEEEAIADYRDHMPPSRKPNRHGYYHQEDE
jgi:hypothetical protein